MRKIHDKLVKFRMKAQLDKDRVVKMLKSTPDDKGLLNCLRQVTDIIKSYDFFIGYNKKYPGTCPDCTDQYITKDGQVLDDCIGCIKTGLAMLKDMEDTHETSD